MKKNIKQKEKGFTLIELLAVIVVLAILALIAVPIVLNIIKDARNNSNKRSIESYVRSIEYAISEHLSENPDQEIVTWEDVKDKVEYKGKVECKWGENLSSISQTGEITLHGCKVNNKTNTIYGYVDGKVVEEKEEEKKETAVETLLKKANAESVTTYTDGDTHEMYTFTHGATTQTEALTDYRYIGNDPYNYVTFNNELWRIIGIFEVEDGNGNKEQRIKIIRDESIGNIVWDSNANEWTTATLNTYLNGDYYNSLSEESKRMIGNTKYYLGGSSSVSHSGPTYYAFERGTTVYTGRSTNWIGKIGLMYPSDYAYTYAKGVDNKCYTYTYNCETSTPTKGWLYNSAYQWLISPNYVDSNYAFFVSSAGFLYGNRVTNDYGMRPSIYLISGIGIEEGTGTQEDPYTLK